MARLDERIDSLTNLVADLAHFFQRPIFRVFKRPIVPRKPWHIGTLIAASHGDQERGALDEGRPSSAAGEPQLRSMPTSRMASMTSG